MNVLVIGGGGREHALAWKAAQAENVNTVFVAPGNAGTALEPNIKNVPIAADDVNGLLAFAQQNHIDLTIVGPEAPLVLGVVDVFRAADLAIFGPTQGAAQLEGSKAFSKDFLARHNIPTAAYGTFTDVQQAKAYVEQHGTPIVIKADGLAAGKGVIIAQNQDEAFAAIDDMLAGNRFGEAGSRVVIEEFLVGEEASFIVMVDGKTALPFASSQDHKARDNGDKGPNTGGMGAYSPAPVVTPDVHDWVMQNVIQPTVEGMAAEGHPYTGFLYAGLMIAPDGTAKVLEYNCRFGDPETQPIMLRLQSNLVELCQAACAGQLSGRDIAFDPRASVGVVMAAGGYPDNYGKGAVIEGITEAEAEGTKVFHAGTALNDNNQLVTAGGRVLCVTALGDTVTQAQQTAYAGVSKVSWDNVYYRTDIAHRAIRREQAS
ncbi:phosphoribosylamine--glycine ligase [Pseudidiomarina donghaiensis]|uniref:Phosphoribosylamine--glycine ligase n=1 Tax=Pseudidiomarina donghaiensis TaxID=519452 RepID=A0A432XIK2_9GAMM|nr:phosphoribosylamine--glycine ligase [Pseudidiomarina donghaiensis]RUO48594.1 phosphoribosylamine--glycine ligase [Pseudidiomarina donghaiensis]SFV24029.1 phosphoribosylamine--glycine ligase [Pseudidiomarina donghaiensis]